MTTATLPLRRVTLALIAAAPALAAACADTTAPASAAVPEAATALAAYPTGPRTIRGTVLDLSAGRVWGDSAGGTPMPAPLAGATVAIALVTRTPNGADTSKAGWAYVPFARLTTGADGRFAAGDVAEGYYALDVTPPAGSPLKPVRTFGVSVLPSDPFRWEIPLSR